MKKYLVLLVCVSVVALGFVSCVKDNFAVKDKFSGDIQWNPDLAIPLAKAKLTLRNMLRERKDTLFYVTEPSLNYGSNAGDSVLFLRFGIDTTQEIGLLDLPKMEAYDTVLLLKPVTLPSVALALPLNESITTLLNNNFSAADVATYNSYASSSSPTVDVAAITAVRNTEYTLDGSGDLSNDFEYLSINSGKMKLTCANSFTVPIAFDAVEIVVDSAGIRKPLATFDFSSSGWINPINPQDWVQIDPQNPPTNMQGTVSVEVPIVNAYIGQKLYYTYKNLRFAAATNVPLTTTILNNSTLFSVISFSNLVVVKGKAVVPQQVISTDTTVYATVSPEKSYQKIFELHVAKGEINYDITSHVEIATHVIFTFPTITKNGVAVFTPEITIDQTNTHVTGSLVLDGSVIDLTKSYNNTQAYNSLPVEISYRVEAQGMTEFDDQQSIELKIWNQDSLQFSFVRGNIGSGTEPIAHDVIDFDMSDILSVFSGEVQFADPRLVLNFNNAISVGAEIEIDMTASNNSGETVQMFNGGSKKFVINAPTCTGVLNQQQVSTTISLDRNTSNIVDFLRIMPSFMEYEGSLLYNPADLTATSDNCISNKSKVGFSIDVDVPMNLSFSNIVLSTDVDIDDPIGDAMSLDTLVISIFAKNQFPIDAQLKLSMLDTTKAAGSQVLGELPAQILKAAPTDANGKVARTVVQEYRSDIGVSRNLFDAFTAANSIRIEATLVSKDVDKGKSIILYSYYTIDVRIAANGKILYKDRL
ncbi:MAG: hypothetical protein LBU90_01315 [Bacteroidales bacterium]|jgi:hypothetical protein|nr:hypothetical protein [Bacteroidales bacterium]